MEMRNFYNDLPIDDCFIYLKEVFGKEKKNYFFVHTFTIDSLIKKKAINNKSNIKIVNLTRNSNDVLNSSLALARSGYENSVIMRKQIIRDYGNILKNINIESIKYIDFLSKSIGVRDTMLIVFAVQSAQIMLNDMRLGVTLGIKSFDIDELTNDLLVAKLFLSDYVCENRIIKEVDVKNFQISLKNRVNSHINSKKDKLLDMALKLFGKATLQSDGQHFPQDTVIKNIATDFYREINNEDLNLKKEVMEILHRILIDKHNHEQKTFYMRELFSKFSRIIKSEGIKGLAKRLKRKLGI